MKNGGFFFHTIFLCCIVFGFSPCAYADIADDFSGAVGEYTNFNAVSAASLGWNGVSVGTVLVQGGANVSAAYYCCTGATDVTVTLYSVLPAYATQGDDGVFSRVRREGIRYPLRYSAAGDMVYLSRAGQACAGYYDLTQGKYLFSPCGALPSDCVTYGVSVWYSRNGWQEAALTLTADSACTGCFMQRYRAAIPAGATAVRILLTEQNQVPVLGRSIRQQMRLTPSMALGSVFIAGAVPPERALPDENANDGGFFFELPEDGEAAANDHEDAGVYDFFYDAAWFNEEMLTQMQEYRNAVTDVLRQPQEAPEESADSFPAEQTVKEGAREKRTEPKSKDGDSLPVSVQTAAPVSVDAGGAFWKRADVITAALILTVGALAAVRILLQGKKQ